MKKKTDTTTELFLALAKPTLRDLVSWIEEKRKPGENLTFEHWVGDWWYINIKLDDKFYPYNRLMGITVNLETDSIMWSNDFSDNPHGGNCFVRSERWYRLLRKKFKGLTTSRSRAAFENAQVYDYRKPRAVRQSIPG